MNHGRRPFLRTLRTQHTVPATDPIPDQTQCSSCAPDTPVFKSEMPSTGKLPLYRDKILAAGHAHATDFGAAPAAPAHKAVISVFEKSLNVMVKNYVVTSRKLARVSLAVDARGILSARRAPKAHGAG
jgi:hypothetical protein